MPKYKCLDNVKIREGPSIQFDKIGNLYPGNIVEFQDFVGNEGRIWGQLNENQYCCYNDNDGQIYFRIIEEGDEDVSMLQKNSKYKGVRDSGCCFLCACYLGGLNNIKEADECFVWAFKNEKVNKKDSYVNINKYDLAKEIAELYNRNQRRGTIIKGNNHFYVIDDNGNEIFNSVKPNYGH